MRNIENFIIEGNTKLSNEEKLYFSIITYLSKKCDEKVVKYFLERLEDGILDKFGAFFEQGIKDNKFANIPEPLGDETPETILNFIKEITEEEADNLIR